MTAASLATQEGAVGNAAGAPGAPGVSGRESEGTAALSHPLEGHKDSVYSVAINAASTVVASGGTKKVCRRCATVCLTARALCCVKEWHSLFVWDGVVMHLARRQGRVDGREEEGCILEGSLAPPC